MTKPLLYALLAGSAVCVASVLVDKTILAPKDGGAILARPSRLHTAPRAADRPAAGREETAPAAAGVESTGETEQVRTCTAPAGAQDLARPPLSGAELVQRASQVQYEADRKVVRLDRRVGLTDDQYPRVFMVYARASSAYDPSIPVEGQVATASAPDTSTSQSPDAQIYETLNDDQQAAFGQQWLERDLWWTEIVAQLAADFPEPKVAASGEAAQPSVHQADNIFDILNSVP